jgi:hypothetical protein
MKAFFIIVALFSAPAAAQVAADCGSVRILSSDLREGPAMDYCKYAIAERAKVEAFWGPTWTDVIRIRVDTKYQISRALVPGHFGNRGFMEMPLRRVTRGNGALLHEIVHIYAPHENRFLAEGFWRNSGFCTTAVHTRLPMASLSQHWSASGEEN